jgi:hypothetical protein
MKMVFADLIWRVARIRQQQSTAAVNILTITTGGAPRLAAFETWDAASVLTGSWQLATGN